ncbi:MAG: hypothetical protein LJE69_03245 [Thiohalocapsa sp.]|jgi:regulator of protease activity HflC (stomatin/prohibitin superfamily)|uniref:hypothetical protein n=1 Tax=Thiohalocapsa sp. TaxID=2497641 RepID=UPI0025CEFB0D|nr:hypothetical protein [Thiohalocapsa sp.]MCG6940250.1 hypothetical protein [Thiohalocapsa sp.]
MQDRHSSAEGRGLDAAFNRVLAAEAEARDAIARCREQAAARVAAAEREARAIAQRAERRIQVAHRIADRGIERGLAELAVSGDEAAAGPAPDAAAPDAAALDALAAALAAELTTPFPGSEP